MGFFGRLSNLGKGMVRTRFGEGADARELAVLDAELAAQTRPVVAPRTAPAATTRPEGAGKGPGPAEPAEASDGEPPVMKRTL